MDLSRCRVPPRSYQIEGIKFLIERPYSMNGDEMRMGKSKQVIDAAQILIHEMNVIDRVVVVCPAPGRWVWADPKLGQIAQHVWEGTKNKVTEFHGKNRQWRTEGSGKMVYWIVTNYEYLRNPERLNQLLSHVNERTMLVLDESSAVKSYKAQQTRACLELRKQAGRVVLLNGTPIAHSPADMFSQGELMHPSILEVSRRNVRGEWRPMTGWYPFRYRYAKLGGFQNKQIVGWRNLDDLQARFAPFVIRRLTDDYFDLPPREYEAFPVALKPETWRIYTELKNELVAWLKEGGVAVAAQAGVKVMRLAQITSGFVGGVECEECGTQGCAKCHGVTLREIGREKLDFITEWLASRLEEDESFKIVIWCRFRAELERLHRALSEDPRFAKVSLGQLWGGQSKTDRAAALELLHPRSAPAGAAMLLGIAATGSMGIDLSAASLAMYLSNDRRLVTRLQSEARCAGPMQPKPVWIGDVMATGPEGQRTIDHLVVKQLRSNQDLADMTTSAWVHALTEE